MVSILFNKRLKPLFISIWFWFPRINSWAFLKNKFHDISPSYFFLFQKVSVVVYKKNGECFKNQFFKSKIFKTQIKQKVVVRPPKIFLLFSSLSPFCFLLLSLDFYVSPFLLFSLSPIFRFSLSPFCFLLFAFLFSLLSFSLTFDSCTLFIQFQIL